MDHDELDMAAESLDGVTLGAFDGRVRHLENTVGTMATGLSSVQSTQEAQNARMGRLEEEVKHGNSQILGILNKPKAPSPWVGIATLVMSSIVIIGSVLGFTFSLITGSMQREVDMRFDLANQEMHDNRDEIRDRFDRLTSRMDVDDRREQADAYNNGYSLAKNEGTREKLDHIDEQRHINDRSGESDMDDIRILLERVYTGLQAWGAYTKEHTGKTGETGHPKDHPVIRRED